MAIRARVPDSVTVAVGDVWRIGVSVVDDDGFPASAEDLVATITLPDGVTTVMPAVVDGDRTGRYDVLYTVTVPGRHVAEVAGVVGLAAFTAFGAGLVLGDEVVTLDDLDLYLGAHSFSDEVLQQVLEAEAAAQRRVCRVPATFDADLKEALCRRVARNLAFRRVPLSVLQGDADAGTTNAYPGRDPEIRRLEGPWRRLVVG